MIVPLPAVLRAPWGAGIPDAVGYLTVGRQLGSSQLSADGVLGLPSDGNSLSCRIPASGQVSPLNMQKPGHNQTG